MRRGNSGIELSRLDNIIEEDIEQHDHLDDIKRSWLLQPELKRRRKYIDLGCMLCSTRALKFVLCFIGIAFGVIALSVIISKAIPKHKHVPLSPDNYTAALHKALLFFNAQKSGKLPKNNGVNWRDDSGLHDFTKDGQSLVGGYYDSGDNIKYHFPMSFSMTMLSWTAIEYEHKFRATREYEHIRDLIKWGTDYILLASQSTSPTIDNIYTQVGISRNDSTPDDTYCWMSPEDMDYKRPVQKTHSAPDLGAEMAAALAAASIVFRDDRLYSEKLVKRAQAVFLFARSGQLTYSWSMSFCEITYGSTSHWDEYIWAATWMFYATGNLSYLSVATDPLIAHHAGADRRVFALGAFSWDNKLPGALLLLTRLRLFLDPGYPYEEELIGYHKQTGLTMCSYLQQFHAVNFTRGGLLKLRSGSRHALADAANAAFLASVFIDYLNASGTPGWFCGDNFILSDVLQKFATSQVDYILGKNPLNMSYVVGYNTKFPKHVHHRAASIPRNGVKYSCTEGWRW